MLCLCKFFMRYWMAYCHIYTGAPKYFLEPQGRERLRKVISHAVVAPLYYLAPCRDVAMLCFIGITLGRIQQNFLKWLV